MIVRQLADSELLNGKPPAFPHGCVSGMPSTRWVDLGCVTVRSSHVYVGEELLRQIVKAAKCKPLVDFVALDEELTLLREQYAAQDSRAKELHEELAAATRERDDAIDRATSLEVNLQILEQRERERTRTEPFDLSGELDAEPASPDPPAKTKPASTTKKKAK